MPKALLRIFLFLPSLLGLIPILSAQSGGADLVAVTVNGDREILVSWNLPDGPVFTRQELQRLTTGAGWQTLSVVPLGTITFLDTAVTTTDSIYTYRLVTERATGESQVSNEGLNIRLQSQRVNGAIELSWNSYREWPNGVDHYDLEVREETQGTWELAASFPAGTNSYVDQTPYPEGAIYCWRIRAFEDKGNAASSLSNETCQPVGLIIPNTFSPNFDGINDEWFVDGLNLFPGANFSIYNRWGQEVFQSNSTGFRWNGKDNSSGNDLPDGTYYYTLTIPLREKPFKGYIMLLR